MWTEKRGPDLVLELEEVVDFEVLFASLDYLRRYERRRRVLRDVAQISSFARAAATAQEGVIPLQLEGDQAKIVLDAMGSYSTFVLHTEGISQAECLLAGVALSALDTLCREDGIGVHATDASTFICD